MFLNSLFANIFKEHRDTGTKYKSRIRSRVSNLGDLKNPNLRERVISGDITPSQIATMTTEVTSIRVIIIMILFGC